MINAPFADLFLTKQEVLTDILGQSNAKQQFKSALLTSRHMLIIGPPGVGKTTLAKNLARLLPEIKVNDCGFNCEPTSKLNTVQQDTARVKPLCPKCQTQKNIAIKTIKGTERFVRIQGSPDLTVEDILGDIDPIKALEYGPTSIQAFTPGKIFKANKGILFFDELNRCNEKLQNSLLQVLEEGKATIGSHTIDFPANFIFVGTMNPEETSAVEKLSDVLIDRLDVITMTHPETIAIEKEIATKKGKNLGAVFPEKLLEQTIEFIHNLRNHKDVQRKPSVRASIGIYERAQAQALLNNRKTVTTTDIAQVIVSVIAHRIELKPSVKYLVNAEEFIAKEFEKFSAEHKFGNGNNGKGSGSL